MSNKLTLLCLLVIAAIAATSCNGGGSGNPAPTQSPTPTPSPTSQPTPTPLSVAYVTTGDKINICNVESNTTLTQCTPVTSPIQKSDSIVLESSGKYIYISSNIDPVMGLDNIASCNITASGLIGQCNTQLYSTYIYGIVLSQSYLYLAGEDRYSGYTTAQCLLNNGMLGSTCLGQTNMSVINAAQSAPTIASNGYFYVISLDNNNYRKSNLKKCSISPRNGNLIDCQTTGGLFGDYYSWAGGIAVNQKSSFAYILVSNNDHNQDSVAICSINNAGEISTTCRYSPANNSSGQNTLHLSLPPFNPMIANNTLFIPNSGSNTVSACPLNADGSLATCVVSTLAQGTSNPTAIWVR